ARTRNTRRRQREGRASPWRPPAGWWKSNRRRRHIRTTSRRRAARARAGCAHPSQREPEEKRVLAPARRGVVLGTDRDLLEAQLAIKVARREVGRAHFQVDDLARR